MRAGSFSCSAGLGLTCAGSGLGSFSGRGCRLKCVRNSKFPSPNGPNSTRHLRSKVRVNSFCKFHCTNISSTNGVLV